MSQIQLPAANGLAAVSALPRVEGDARLAGVAHLRVRGAHGRRDDSGENHRPDDHADQYQDRVHGLSPSRSLTVLGILLALTACSNVRPLVIATHLSDPSDGGVSDTTTDFIGAGATAQFGDVSIEGAIGRKAINCNAFGACPSTLGGMATIRWSPRR